MGTANGQTAYEQDVFTWSQEQAAALRRLAATRTNLPEPVDLLNIAEEIESLGSSQWRELGSRYAVRVAHLLKWRCQPAKRSRSWWTTIKQIDDEFWGVSGRRVGGNHER